MISFFRINITFKEYDYMKILNLLMLVKNLQIIQCSYLMKVNLFNGGGAITSHSSKAVVGTLWTIIS